MKKTAAPFALVMLMSFMLAGCMQVSNFTDSVLETVSFRGKFEEDGDPGLSKRTVIVPFRYGKPELAPQAKAMQEAVHSAMAEYPYVHLVNFRDLQKASIEFGAAELVAEDRYLSGARHLGINLIVVGDISGLYVDYNLLGIYGFRESVPQLTMEGQIRLVDAVRGIVHKYRNFKEAIALDDVDAQLILTGTKPKPEMTEQLIKNIIDNNLPLIMEDVENLPWSGIVLAVRDNQIQITGGRDTGFSPGDKLVLHGQSDRVTTGGGHSIYLLGRPVARVVLGEVAEDSAWGEVTFFDVPTEIEDDDETLGSPSIQIYHVEPGQIVRTR